MVDITSFPDLMELGKARPDGGSCFAWVKTDSLAPIPGAFNPGFAGGVYSVCTASSFPSPLQRQALLSALNPPRISCITDAAAPSRLSQPCSRLAGLALGPGGLVCFAVRVNPQLGVIGVPKWCFFSVLTSFLGFDHFVDPHLAFFPHNGYFFFSPCPR